jgi:hypothetical protein
MSSNALLLTAAMMRKPCITVESLAGIFHRAVGTGLKWTNKIRDRHHFVTLWLTPDGPSFVPVAKTVVRNAARNNLCCGSDIQAWSVTNVEAVWTIHLLAERRSVRTTFQKEESVVCMKEDVQPHRSRCVDFLFGSTNRALN